MFRVSLALIAVTAIGACAIVDPKNFETDPVVIESAAGPVTCQLYTKGSTTWDRAIDRPASMDVATGDALCRNEGVQEQHAM